MRSTTLSVTLTRCTDGRAAQMKRACAGVSDHLRRVACSLGVIASTLAIATAATGFIASTIVLEKRVLPQNPQMGKLTSYPVSVTLCRDASKLAVIASNGSERWIEAISVNTGTRIAEFGDADDTAARWHPLRPLVMAWSDSADKPMCFLSEIATGRRRVLYRSDPYPFCWGPEGVITPFSVVVWNSSVIRTIRAGNFGHRIPWDGERYFHVRQMSCGTKSQIAVQFDGPGEPHLETFRKSPKHMKWVRAGRIDAEVRGDSVVWYPRDPSFLGDGRLVYLRIYPGEWTHAWNDGEPVPAAETARNRAELWVCSLDAHNQQRILTLSDLRPFMESPSADWVTVDGAGKTICYVDREKIHVIRLDKPL